MKINTSVLAKTWTTPVVLIIILLAVALLAPMVGSGPFTRTIAETLIRVVFVIGLYVFIGNSGVISFGHAGFMCLGAYGAAWLTIPPMMKKVLLPGLTPMLADAQLPIVVSGLIAASFAAVVAFLVGLILMRLSGIAASIATFAFLAIVNTIYGNWQSVTGATSSVVGIPIKVSVWSAFSVAVIAVLVAYFYGISRSGLALRAARDEAIAAAASGVDIYRERLISFVVSAFICGAAGVLYSHFLGVVNPDAFYLGITFISLSMLVVGGMNSLSGAVIGVVVISAIIQLLRWLEKGVSIGDASLSLPNGIQEIVIGLVMVVILIVRPNGLTGNREVYWRRWPLNRNSGNGE